MSKLLEPLLPLIVLLSVFAILAGLLRMLLTSRRTASSFPYERINCLFTPAERSFLGVLDRVISAEYRIFGKVRAADVLRVSKGLNKNEWQQAFNKIQSKHFDFAVYRASDLTIALLIELDDKSHSNTARRSRDIFIESATQAAGIPLLRVACQKSYSQQMLTEQLAEHLENTNEANQVAWND
jgi:hypothetical protein